MTLLSINQQHNALRGIETKHTIDNKIITYLFKVPWLPSDESSTQILTL